LVIPADDTARLLLRALLRDARIELDAALQPLQRRLADDPGDEAADAAMRWLLVQHIAHDLAERPTTPQRELPS
jgi:hypothetical protein